jgi:hypothetical protein
MTEPLPPELSRLGDAIARATEARVVARRRRNAVLARMGATGIAASLALAALAPGVLQPGDGAPSPLLASSRVVYQPMACDRPRGATFAAARPCASPGSTDVTLDLLARRYAVH